METWVRVCYLMDLEGNTIASNNCVDPDSFAGHYSCLFEEVFL
jgi:C4-dicarboxylate-specific signal transduction histidine kinase